MTSEKDFSEESPAETTKFSPGEPKSDSPEANAPNVPSTAAERFRNQVATDQKKLEDYDPEEELWSGGYSPKAMLGTWLVLILVTIATFIGTFMTPSLTLSMTSLGLLALWGVAITIYASRRLGVHYELTSQRFIHQSGLLTRHTDRIEVIDIDDVSYKQGPIQRVLGVGTIFITSSDRSHPELSLTGISGVKEVAGLIDDIRRTERRKRSLHIEAI